MAGDIRDQGEVPGEGSLDSPMTRAKRSRQFPTAMSMVSPKI